MSGRCGLLPVFHQTKSNGVRRQTSLRSATLPDRLPPPKENVFAECACGGRNRYAGCGRELAEGRHEIVRFMERMHDESMKMLRQLSDDQLQQKCESADGTPMTTWKLLRSMVEHEVHHRGELYALLGVLGVSVPPLYGLTSEQLREIAGRVNSLS